MQGRKDYQLAVQAPVLAVLSSRGDGKRDWVQSGCGLARMLLEATTLGLAASFLNQVVEEPELRERVRDLLGGGVYPQLVVRVGYGVKTVRSPRQEAEVQ